MSEVTKNEEKKKWLFGRFPPPERECDDENCPFHGHLRVHGRIFRGIVTSAKRQKTVTVLIEYIKRDRKYKRFMKEHSKLHAHNPPCINAREGDIVWIAECRPISKTKRFVVVYVEKRAKAE